MVVVMEVTKGGSVLVLQKENVWKDTFEIWDICKSYFNLPLKIRFTGKQAVDLGGPKIEFFSLFFQGLQQQRIVISSSPRYFAP